MVTTSEHLLLKDIAQNDSQSAFELLYKSYFNKLMRFVMMYVHTPEDAEEIVSDTFLFLWNNRKTLEEKENFQAFIYTIARNKAISYYRTQKFTTKELNENTITLFAQTDTSPEDRLISQEQIEKINYAIESLPDKCKEVFKLIREDNMKYKEVAEILNISEKTVEAHMNAATKKIRLALSMIIFLMFIISLL